MTWKIAADIWRDGTSQIVVTLPNGKEEIFKQINGERLGAYVWKSFDKDGGDLFIGYWDKDGKWLDGRAYFQGKTYLYVRTR
jgi:hypothetical protein